MNGNEEDKDKEGHHHSERIPPQMKMMGRSRPSKNHDSVEFVYTYTTMEYIYPPSSRFVKNSLRIRKEYAPIDCSYVKYDEFSVNYT